MTDWFRSWHGAPTDPKWLGIAKRAGVAPGIAVAIAWALMDRASQAADRGSIAGYDADGLGCFFGCEATQVDAVVQAMRDKAMLEGDRFAAWERRQPKREDDSTKRVRAHREREVTQGNASDALPSVSVSSSVQDKAPTKKKEASPRATPRSELAAVLDEERADAVIEHRQRLRKPLTAYAAKQLAANLVRAPHPNEAADAMIANGWLGFKPEWLEGRGTGPPSGRSQNGFARYALDLARQDHDEPAYNHQSQAPGDSSGGLPLGRGPQEPGMLDAGQSAAAGGTHTGSHRR